MEELTETNSIQILNYGGDDGDLFAPDFIKSIAIRSGTAIDAIIINGAQHGGDGGSLSPTLVFDVDEYIKYVALWADDRINYLQFVTNKGNSIEGGSHIGTDHVLSDIRVIAIGGRSGARLDQIQITLVFDYEDSTKIEELAQFVIDFIPQNTVINKYLETFYQQVESYENITQTMLSHQYTASIQAEYYAKVAFATEIKYVNTNTETIKQELTRVLVNGESTQSTVKEGQVGLLLLNGTIMQRSGEIWMFPTSGLSYAIIQITDFENVLNYYDLKGQLATQMPGLLPYKKVKHGYVFYQA